MLTAPRRAFAAATMTAVVALGVTGCSLMPASWTTALGQAKSVTAYFDDVSGLFVGNDVAVLGMPVGRITSVEPEGTRVKVVFTVSNDVDVPEDATAAIVNTSIVTTRHIELTPAYTKGPTLQDGGTVKNTEAPVEIGTLFDAVDSLVENLSGDKPGTGPIADFVDVTSGIASGNGAKLRDALTALAAAGKTGADNSDSLTEILKAMSTLTTALTDNYPKMMAFSSSMTQVSQMLGDQSVGLVATLDDLNKALQNTSEFLEANSGTISSSTSRMAAVTANLSDFSREVVDGIDMAPLLFQNLSNSISAEQGAWRASVLLDKSLVDNELSNRLCEAINVNKKGCRTGQLGDFGPDLGIYSGLLGLLQK
ncbi:virulence factor Mce family protein [Gordonia malaquae]|uniref:Mce family protein n=1 Tax=Gordonia malaquae NBRC 108250 TaxID=1223542 RepID=M3UH07_GORML|nr:MCE family protein [Gordonia malaquae]GAC78600.1 Mce family protein [Gordonia malaquae NBRC 108250]SED54993.1 virulence factor Mce family protein [Gordonia malaquae]